MKPSYLIDRHKEKFQWHIRAVKEDIKFLENSMLETKDCSEKNILNKLYVKLHILEEAYKQAIEVLEENK